MPVTSPAKKGRQSAATSPARVQPGIIETRTIAKWPDGPALDPYEIDAVTGWHCAEEGGWWDVPAICDALRKALVHSHWCGRSSTQTSAKEWQTIVWAPQEHLFIAIGQTYPEYSLLRVWAHSPEIADAEFRKLRAKYFRARPRDDQPDQAEFYVLTVRMGEPLVRVVRVTPKLQTANELQLHYGEDFLAWHLHFLRQLKTKSSGLAILQGLPGTGKTSYLRHLMCELRRTHRCYFFPITSYPLLTSPACVDFWLGEHEQYKDFEKIVVIEDAESLLLRRGPDNQEVLSNLLNLADGFLGDCLKLQVICTVNAPSAKLDPAIIRPGRLIASREFRRLRPLEAERIAERSGIKLAPQESYSLAEIYNHANSREPLSADNDRAGFAAQRHDLGRSNDKVG